MIYGMLLGHWYLVTPKMSLLPLKVTNIIIWIVLGAKIIFSGFELFENMDYFEPLTRKGEGYLFNVLFTSMRFLWGYLIILIMSIFNWRLLLLNSTQSATGMLYAMTFFVIVGELISSFLFFNMGLFL